MNAAQRMRQLGRRQTSGGAPSSIFGSAAGMAQSIETEDRLRVSVYPFVCPDMPEVAMGLASCFAYLLEQFPSTRAHRVFARMDNGGDSDEIAPQDYQFSPDDWQLRGLRDNVQMWGRLDVGDAIELTISVDTTLYDGEPGFEVSGEYPSIAILVTDLQDFVENLWEQVTNSNQFPMLIEFNPLVDDREVAETLPLVFDWNLDVYLSFWDQPWQATDIRNQFMELAELAKGHPGDFSEWCLGMMAMQVMQPGLDDVGDALLPQLPPLFDDMGQASLPAFGASLAEMGYQERAVTMLERYLDRDEIGIIWHTMTDILLDAGRFKEAVDNAQTALEAGYDDPALFLQYAKLLLTAEAQGWDVDELMLTDPDEVDEDLHITQEIANAFKMHLVDNPENLAALEQAITFMIDCDDDELWLYFSLLVQNDLKGEYLGEVCERLMDHDELASAYAELESHANENPVAYACMARMAVEEGDIERAEQRIADCRARIDASSHLEPRLQAMELMIALPGFEESIAELRLSLSANQSVSEKDISYLETVCELAPGILDTYLILATCYAFSGDGDAALEVLLEAEETLGGNAVLANSIAQVYASVGQPQAAVDKLNEGMAAFPHDANLRLQVATMLIMNGQMDDARDYIAIAEAIDPSHPTLHEVRQLIAQRVAQQN